MIDLRIFGGAALERGGVPVHSVLAQPKRFALFVHLALAGRSAAIRRDALLAMFWPESDEDRARGSLRTSVHFLRRGLGDDVIVADGADGLGVRDGAIRCDAVDFEAALRRGRLVEALELYGGPLLPGFNLENAPAWEEWLDLERRRLNRLAADAAWTLADRALDAGNAAEAIARARQAASFTPLEEEPTRRLMTVLADAGDTAAALLVYEEFVAAANTDLGTTASARTHALASTIRTAARVRARSDGARAESGAAAVPASAESAAPLDAASRAGVGRRRLITPLAGLAVLCLTLLAAAVSALRPLTPPPTPDPAAAERLVVLPFAVRGVVQLDHLGEGMVELMSAALDGAGALRAVDPRAVLGPAAPHAAGMSPRDAARIAERFSARYYVLGGVVAMPDRMVITASLYDAWGARKEPLGTAGVEGSVDELFRLVERLTEQLLATSLRAAGERTDYAAAQTTPSLAALKLYLRGAHHLRSGEFDRAVEAFEEVLAEDSTFAMAAYQLAIAADQAGLFERPRSAALLAFANAERLPPVERRLVDALISQGQPERTKRIYREILATAPDRVEAWYQLADMLFHEAPRNGRAYDEAEAAFRQVLRYEPQHAAALQHLARIAALAGNRAAVDTFTSAGTRRAIGDVALEMDALRFLVLSDTAARERVLSTFSSTADNRVWLTTWRAANHSGNYLDARLLLRVLTETTRARDVRAWGHIGIAYLELGSGRPGAAAAHLEQAERLQPASTIRHRAITAAYPFLTGRCTPDPSLRTALEARSLPDVPGLLGSAARYHLRDTDSHARGYLRALLAACAGEGDEIERRLPALAPTHADRLDHAAAVLAWAAITGGSDSMPELRARLAEQDAAAAEQPQVRFLMAELARLSDDDAAAIAWYATVQNDLDYIGAAFAPAARLRRAELLQRQQRGADAAREYQRLDWLMRAAEPPVAALLSSHR